MYDPYFYPNGYRKTELPGGLYTNLAVYTYPENVPPALELVEDAVSKEMEDELFYNYLINASPNQESKNIIAGIRNDELRHNKMFRTIYYQLTGELLTAATVGTFTKPQSFSDGIKTGIEGETKAIVRHGKILFAMQNRVHFNMLTEIINDELRHGILYNLLLTMNYHPELAQTSFQQDI